MGVPDDNPVFNRHVLTFSYLGLFTSIINNGITRRPVFSGFHRHLLSIALGGALGYAVRKFERRHWAERDWYIAEYISRHPEDFKEEKKPDLRDVFEAWVPVK
ncbi:NADH dehydrogenase [ubiquinone] 1 subunit C2-like [Glandiceps talaboti]